MARTKLKQNPSRKLRLQSLEARTVPAVGLLADINQQDYAYSSGPGQFVELGESVVFTAGNAAYGYELWKTDGTEAGTSLLKDVNTAPSSTGTFSSSPSNLTRVNDAVFFTAYDKRGYGLWKTDGGNAGTVKIKDFTKYFTSYAPPLANFTAVNGKLFFTVKDRELWKSDGTAKGTVRVKDLTYHEANRKWPAEFKSLTNVDGTLFFTAFATGKGEELWKSNGTATGTKVVKDINPGFYSSSPSELVNVNGTLYFTAFKEVTGREIWKTDGTAAGTKEMREVYPGRDGLVPTQLTNVNGTLYFVGNDAVHGDEVWKSDGTDVGTTMLKDIDSAYSSSPGGLTDINGVLYFSYNHSTNGPGLWSSDGTELGTVLVKSLNNGSAGVPRNLTDVDGRLFFQSDDGIHGRELWTSDGTELGTTLVKDILSAGSFAQLSELTAAKGRLFFSADDGTHAHEVWTSDGTELGTTLLKDINTATSPLSSSPNNFLDVNGTIYFRASDGIHGRELWKTDGTSAGTELLLDVNPGNADSLSSGFIESVSNLAHFNGETYFVADDGVHGRELWKTDGTPGGTMLVKDANDGSISSGPRHLTVFSGKLYFTADDGINGTELWSSDGTEVGTAMVEDIFPGTGHSLPDNLAVFNGNLYFSANTPVGGRKLFKSDGTSLSPATFGASGGQQLNGTLFFASGDGLWKTDGTDLGTVLIKEFEVPAFYSGPSLLTLVNDTLFFVVNDGVHFTELWKSDGTEAGTEMVKNISQSSHSYPRDLTNVDGTLYFTANNDSGDKLFKSDGTEPGTVQVSTKVVEPTELTEVDGQLYFSARDSVTFKNGLWQTDGTENGTTLVSDIVASSLFASKGDLYFSGGGTSGSELWHVLNEPTVTIEQAAGQDDPVGSATISFDVSFSEPVTGFDETDIDLSASTVGGAPVAALTQLTPTTYRVDVTGMSGAGYVVAHIPEGVVEDSVGHPNPASTSIDNSVGYSRAGRISLSETLITVTEGTTVNITATRIGASEGAVSVDCDLIPGTALAGLDYGDLVGTLSWADGETGAKSVSFLIVDDDASELKESLGVVLSNPIGSLFPPLTSQMTEAVEIDPSDSLGSGTPFTDEDGDIVTVKLSSGGSLKYYLNDPDGSGEGSILLMELTGTFSPSSLSVTVKKGPGLSDGLVDVGAITGTGYFKAFDLQKTTLAGSGIQLTDLTIVGSLKLAAIKNGADILAPIPKIAVSGAIEDGTTIEFPGTLKSFTAASMGTGQINVGSIGSMIIKGDFAADINVSGYAIDPVKGTAVKSIKIAGKVDGSDISVNGNVGSFSAGEFFNSTLFARYVGDANGNGMFEPAAIGSFTTVKSKTSSGEFKNSSVIATSIGKVKLASVHPENTDQLFGFFADAVKSVTVGVTKLTYSNLMPYLDDDFTVLLV